MSGCDAGQCELQGCGKVGLEFARLDEEAFAAAPDISVDYAIFERAVLPVSLGWSDLGSWDAVGRPARVMTPEALAPAR